MTTIEIDLNELLGIDYGSDGEPIGRHDLRDEIVKRAADQLANEYRRDAKAKISDRVDRVIGEEIRTIVRDTLAQPIQRRKLWGDPDGELTSVLEIAREKLQEYFDKPGRGDRYDSRPSQNLTELITETVKAAMLVEFKPAVAEARAAVSARLQEALTQAVATSVVAGR